ncbi:MAG: hypothetical protein HW390_428 [Candidatus Brocadiaceae bacterium]|nr:hypothetical protein [Candidatus Brocadiaceae bacterium]
MRKIYYALIDIKEYFLDSCFDAKRGFTQDINKIRSFGTINEFLKSDYFNKQDCELAILWHITGTESYELTKENRQKIDEKYGGKVIFKVCKSESGSAIKEAKEQPWFDIVGSGSDILKYFTDNEWDIEKCIKNLPKIKAVEKLRLILTLFLPLDIDLQALTDERLTDKSKYLKEMLSDVEDSFFMNKFENSRKGIEGITDENYGKKLNDLFDKNSFDIHNFLNSLDKRKANLMGEELNEKFWEDITSFHDWYSQLVILRDSLDERCVDKTTYQKT